jgi:8-oxo-dGTP pyrophosphatase MutT (NUDIX family)
VTTDTKEQYVQQYVFSRDLQRVVLLLKLKGPDFVIGKINGQGGQMIPGESPAAAASRETKEESNLVVAPEDWQLVQVIERDNAIMTVLCARADLSTAKTMESEPIVVLDVSAVRMIAHVNPAAIVSDVLPLVEKAIGILSFYAPQAGSMGARGSF